MALATEALARRRVDRGTPATMARFLERIGKPDVKLTPQSPMAYWTMELYAKRDVGTKGGGGLGVLAGDTRRVAEQLGITFVTVTPFYPVEGHQRLGSQFDQQVGLKIVSPEDHGFTPKRDVRVSIKTRTHDDVPLEIWEKQLGSTKVLTVTEPNLGQLYAGENNDDHRLYQEVALGFGGHQMLKKLGIEPPVMQLNEAPTVFAAIAALDDRAMKGNFFLALKHVREMTLFTNHTLVDAVEAPFTIEQFDELVMPNITNKGVESWIRRQFKVNPENGRRELKLSTLALNLSDKRSAVSKLHAEVAEFPDPRNGGKAEFTPVTNGISVAEWGNPALIDHYRETGVLDDLDMVTPGFREAIANLDVAELRVLKQVGRQELNKLLTQRHDQYGNGVEISDNAVIFNWKRRFAGYKRPDIFFDDPEKLAGILEGTNGHLVITGKAHPADQKMIGELKRILEVIDGNDVLRERVHYITDYDEPLGRALGIGADVAVNVPIVGQEACGTSWEKDMLNLGLLISTEDGGVADIKPPRYLLVEGETPEAETAMLYDQMVRAAGIVRNDNEWHGAVTTQLAEYAEIITGGRMMADYIHLLFPQQDVQAVIADGPTDSEILMGWTGGEIVSPEIHDPKIARDVATEIELFTRNAGGINENDHPIHGTIRQNPEGVLRDQRLFVVEKEGTMYKGTIVRADEVHDGGRRRVVAMRLDELDKSSEVTKTTSYTVKADIGHDRRVTYRTGSISQYTPDPIPGIQ